MKLSKATTICFSAALLLLTSCQGVSHKDPGDATSPKETTTTASTTQSTEQEPAERIVISPVDSDKDIIGFDDGGQMYCYYQSEWELDGEKATVELYIDAHPDENGILGLQDGQMWSLIVRMGDKVYPILSKKYVMFGPVNYYLTQGSDPSAAHLIVFIQWGEGIEIYEYELDTKMSAFTGNKVYGFDETIIAYSKGDYPRIHQEIKKGMQ